MLKIKKVKKVYKTGDFQQEALAGVDMSFNLGEFTSILGPSGSGKTTLLNIIGGLDQYTEGDLVINGRSTKDFKSKDWDAYRNNSIGFVFQSYNLISHISVLENVEMSMTLSGMGKQDRQAKAKKALERVGLIDHIYKKPNQLSGGQKQRVAIARALSNDPDIILADEPTGALDSVTSESIMTLLKEISNDKLVIMVTHNRELAETYSSRIISLRDGHVEADTRTHQVASKDSQYKAKKTKMKVTTALKLSFNNLRTKYKRTLITAIAGSIGIIGVSLVLSLSNGMSQEITAMETDQLSAMPITISERPTIIQMGPGEDSQEGPIESSQAIIPYDPGQEGVVHKNIIGGDLVEALDQMDSSLYETIQYERSINLNVIRETASGLSLLQAPQSEGNDGPGDMSTGTDSLMQELPNSQAMIQEDYDLLAGHLPEDKGDLVLVLEDDYRLDQKLLEALDIPLTDQVDFSQVLGQTYVIAMNQDLYVKSGDFYERAADLQAAYEGGYTVEIVGIIKSKTGQEGQDLGNGFKVIAPGLYYTQDLTDYLLEESTQSSVVKDQMASDYDLLTGRPFNDFYSQSDALRQLGGLTSPVAINIYPVDYNAKTAIKTYLDEFNQGRSDLERIEYTDLSEQISSSITSMIDMIEMVLVAFAAISLVVSAIMIGIITYVSVLERTKEIGVLRSLGASKKDIKSVFYAETAIIGFFSGALGIGLTLLLSYPISSILEGSLGMANLVSVSALESGVLILVSTLLTMVSGFIPASIAAKKNPVEALRSE